MGIEMAVGQSKPSKEENAAQARSGVNEWRSGLEDDVIENKKTELREQIAQIAVEIEAVQDALVREVEVAKLALQDPTVAKWPKEKQDQFRRSMSENPSSQKAKLLENKNALEVKKATLEAEVEGLEGRLKS